VYIAERRAPSEWRALQNADADARREFRVSSNYSGREAIAMPLINVVMVLLVVGVLLWLVNRFIPMQGTIKSILNAVVVIAVVLWLLNVFGLFSYFSHIRVGS
jgi:ABC-type long-subunit fatty acid transport system fused permease/ATPase subunit